MVAKKNAPAAYTPIGDEISLAIAFGQAAAALDIAATMAVESRDVESLSQIAMVWIEMGSRLGSGEDDDVDDDGDLAGESDDYPLGFASPAVDARIKEKRKNDKS